MEILEKLKTVSDTINASQKLYPVRDQLIYQARKEGKKWREIEQATNQRRQRLYDIYQQECSKHQDG